MYHDQFIADNNVQFQSHIILKCHQYPQGDFQALYLDELLLQNVSIQQTSNFSRCSVLLDQEEDLLDFFPKFKEVLIRYTQIQGTIYLYTKTNLSGQQHQDVSMFIIDLSLFQQFIQLRYLYEWVL